MATRANLRVKTNAHATRILFEGKRAVGVEYRQGKESRQIRARREVILSSGAFQSPQLLMLSGNPLCQFFAPGVDQKSWLISVSI